MAKVTGPVLSINAQGKLASTVIFTDNKGSKRVKKYTVPENPQSTDQQIQRNYLKEAVLAWKTDGYTQFDIEAWKLYASIQKKTLSGYNLFLRKRIDAAKVEITWWKLTNCIIEDITSVSCNVYVDASTNMQDRLYLGTSKYSMLRECPGIFDGEKYKFSVANLEELTRYYFNVHYMYDERAQRTGIYQFKTIKYAPSALSIGNQAIDRFDSIGGEITLVDSYNPANKTGIITKIEIFAPYGSTGVRVAGFYVVSGNFLSTRNYVVIGDIPSGYSSYDVQLEIQEGDFIGIYTGAGDIDTDNSGVGRWVAVDDQIPCTNKEFFWGSGDTISLHGTGPV